MDDNNRIIIRRISRSRQSTSEDGLHVFDTGSTGNRWLSYLLLAPVLIVMAILGIFFFTAFLALFAVAAAGLGFRLWWLRRKLNQAAKAAEEAETAEKTAGDRTIIEDAEIIEETTLRASDRNGDRR